MLSIIAEMNSKSIQLNSLSPFEYQHEKDVAAQEKETRENDNGSSDQVAATAAVEE